MLKREPFVLTGRCRGATSTLGLAILMLLATVATPRAEAQPQTIFRLLYSFTGTGGDGADPSAGLIRDAAGNLYGTTLNGGASSNGTVFKLDTTGTETVLHSFSGPPLDGQYPQADLVRDAAGNLYGTTLNGGGAYAGMVFKVDTTGTETVLYNFTGAADGDGPNGLLMDSAGNLYGTTRSGGNLTFCAPYGCGTVFKLDTAGNETVLYSFSGAPLDGDFPVAGLIRDAAGNLYGTTLEGGPSNLGTVFRLDTTGTETVLYSFTGGTDGADPFAGLLRDAAGNLYGTTNGGGALNLGTVFKLDRARNETVLYSFTGADGSGPSAGLVRDAAGNLYGTTQIGGAFGRGTIFKLDSTGVETVLHSFTGGGGAGPLGKLVRDAAGNLYGTTSAGGVSHAGTVFKLHR